MPFLNKKRNSSKKASSRRLAIEERQEKIKILNIVSFLMGLGGAVVSYVVSAYFKEIIGSDNVGWFFSFSYIVVLVSLFNFHHLVSWIGKAMVFYVLLAARFVASFILIFNPSAFWAVVFLVIYIITEVLMWTALDIILEAFSTDGRSGRIRGLYLTISNIGYLIGPFLAGQIVTQFSFSGIFAAVAIILSVIGAIAAVGLRNLNHTFHRQETLKDLFRRLRRRDNVLRIYYISFILEFFYAIMVVYTPLYLLDLGFSWKEIGLLFTIMLIPFVIIEYPAGVLADKFLGEKEMLIFGTLIMAWSTLEFFLSQSTDFLFWAVVLFVTRVGASLIESLRDSYFYKKVDGDDVDLINFFRTSRPVAYIVSTGLLSLFLFYLPINFLFLITAAVIFTALWPAFRLVDTK